MHLHAKSRRRFGARMAVLATVAGTGLLVATATPALAAPVPGTASGATTITLGGKAINTLLANGCGGLSVTFTNGANFSVTPKLQLKMIFPISGIVTQPTNDDALRIDHNGSVSFENDCYAVTLSALRVTNFGLPNQGAELDVSAVTKSADDSGRQVVFTLDLSGSQTSTTGSKTRISQMNLLTTADGAEELNQLAVGGDGSTGPFSAGQKVGNAKTRIVVAS
jgi:hypothetical protein